MGEKTTQVAFRLPDDLLERLDAHAERMREAQPGVNVTRTDVVRTLLTRALEDAESRAKGRGKRSSRSNEPAPQSRRRTLGSGGASGSTRRAR